MSMDFVHNSGMSYIHAPRGTETRLFFLCLIVLAGLWGAQACDDSSDGDGDADGDVDGDVDADGDPDQDQVQDQDQVGDLTEMVAA